jgi:hypothetical protein
MWHIWVTRDLYPAGSISSPVTPAQLRTSLAAGIAAGDRMIRVDVIDMNVMHVSTYLPREGYRVMRTTHELGHQG